jgi:small subunit ribosomal protein S21
VGGLVGFSAAAGGSASFRFRPDLSCPIGDPAGPAGGGSALFFSDLDKKRRIGLKSIQVSFDELTTVRDFLKSRRSTWFFVSGSIFGGRFGELMVKLLVREKESIQEAVRRFKKLVERSGIKREMRRREYYEKPSEVRRRARLRAEMRSRTKRRTTSL